MREKKEVFRIVLLNSNIFCTPFSEHNSGFKPFFLPIQSANGRPMLIIGCKQGVWLGFRDDAKSMRQVLHLSNVTYCEVLLELGLLLVLAHKALYAFRMDELRPVSSKNSSNVSNRAHKISGNKDVHLFRAGKLNGRTLVITVQEKRTDSIFQVLEPEQENNCDKCGSTRAAITFKQSQSFFIASPTYDIAFMKTRVAILNHQGFELLQLDTLKSQTIPSNTTSTDDPNEGFLRRLFSSHLPRAQLSEKPLAIFATGFDDQFILCFDKFGLYVDKHGHPLPERKIEWEVTAERVTHVLTYILLFGGHCIEVRDLQSGDMVQQIRRDNMRCLQRGINTWVQQSSVLTVASVPDGGQIRYEIHDLRPVCSS